MLSSKMEWKEWSLAIVVFQLMNCYNARQTALTDYGEKLENPSEWSSIIEKDHQRNVVPRDLSVSHLSVVKYWRNGLKALRKFGVFNHLLLLCQKTRKIIFKKRKEESLLLLCTFSQNFEFWLISVVLFSLVICLLKYLTPKSH